MRPSMVQLCYRKAKRSTSTEASVIAILSNKIVLLQTEPTCIAQRKTSNRLVNPTGKKGCFMKTITILIPLYFLLFGCITNESRPLPADTAAGNLGQIEQAIGTPCSNDCQCPLTESCSTVTHLCSSYAVFGPDTSPLKCVNDCQCQTYYSPTSHCNLDSGSYGHCSNPCLSCSSGTSCRCGENFCIPNNSLCP